MRYRSQALDIASYADGKTPYIGGNGNWFIDGVDQEIKAIGIDGVSFAGVKEWYYATLATDVDGDGNPNEPEWKLDNWEEHISDTKYGQKSDTEGSIGVTYKYLWNVEEIISKDENNNQSSTYTDVELQDIYMGGRIPAQYISYYLTTPSSSAPEEGQPILADDGNSIVEPDGMLWETEDEFTGSADANVYLHEICFVQYTEEDENGLNKYAKISGPTVIGYNGANGTSPIIISLSQDVDIVARTPQGEVISELPSVTVEIYEGAVLLENAEATLSEFPAAFADEAGKLNTNYASFENQTLIIHQLPEGFTGGFFEFAYNFIEKSFSLNVVTSEVDYDLVLEKSVVNSSYSEGYVGISVKRISQDGITLLDNPLDGYPMQIYIGDSAEPFDPWAIRYSKGETTPKTIILKDTNGNVWDREIIEFVSNGNSTKDFDIKANSYIFAEDENGDINGDIDFTAVPKNLSNTISYQWYTEDTLISGETGSTYKLTSDIFSTLENNGKLTIKCACYEDGSGTAFGTDSITIYRVPCGEAALTIGVSNGNMTFNSADTTATEITSIIAYSGSTPISYVANTPTTASSNWQYTITNLSNTSKMAVRPDGKIKVTNPGSATTLTFKVNVYYNSITAITSKILEINCSQVSDGDSAITLQLTNDSDMVVKNNAGQYISSFPIGSTAELYEGGTKITSGVTYQWKLGSTTKSTNASLSLESSTYSVGNYVVTATYKGNTYTKTFSVRETTAEADYDLIYPSTVNITNGEKTVAVKVLKTGKGYDGDTNDTRTLTEAGSHPIQIQYKPEGDENWNLLSDWSKLSISKTTAIKIVRYPGTSLIWDEGTIEAVQDGQNAIAAISISLSNDLDIVPASSEGIVQTAALSGATTVITVYKDGVALENPTVNCVVKDNNGNTITSSGNYTFSNNVFTLTNWSNDPQWSSVTANFTYSTTIDGQSVSATKNFVMTKMNTEEGQEAIDYYLELSKTSDNTTDSGGSITIQAKQKIGTTINNVSGQSGIVVQKDGSPINAVGTGYTHNYAQKEVGETTFTLLVNGVVWDIESFLLTRNGNDSTVEGPQGYSGATLTLYKKLAADASAADKKPSGKLIYNFSDKVLTEQATGALNGWYASLDDVGTSNNPCYAIYAYASSNEETDDIDADEWSSPIIIEGTNGSPGINTATVFLYQRSSGIPAKPIATLEYTFDTGKISGSLEGWSQTIPASNGNPCYFIQDVVVGTGASAEITKDDWSSPEIYTKDGEASNNEVIDVYKLFAFASGGIGKPTVNAPQSDSDIGSTMESGKWSTDHAAPTDSLPLLFKCQVQKSNGQFLRAGIPELYEAWNDMGVSYPEYAAFVELCNYRPTAGLYYDDDGNLQILATKLTVLKKEGTTNTKANSLFYAGPDANGDGQVYINSGNSADNNLFFLNPLGETLDHNDAPDGSIGDWKMVVGKTFGIRADGELYSSGGKIGGWDITDFGFQHTTSDSVTHYFGTPKTLDSKNNIIFKAGNNFYINSSGDITATSGSIGGWNITSTGIWRGNNSGIPTYYWGDAKNFDEAISKTSVVLKINDNFYVNHLGAIHASSGQIGGWEISSSKLSSTSQIGKVVLSSNGKAYSSLSTSGKKPSMLSVLSPAMGEYIQGGYDIDLTHTPADTFTAELTGWYDDGAAHQKFDFIEIGPLGITLYLGIEKLVEKQRQMIVDFEKSEILSASQKFIDCWNNSISNNWITSIHGFKTAIEGTIFLDTSTNYFDEENPKFYILQDGSMYAKHAKIEGEIKAKRGEIGGWDIGEKTLTNFSGKTSTGTFNNETVTYYDESFCMEIPWDGTNNVLAIGKCAAETWDQANFRVTKTGQLYATEARFYQEMTLQSDASSTKKIVITEEGIFFGVPRSENSYIDSYPGIMYDSLNGAWILVDTYISLSEIRHNASGLFKLCGWTLDTAKLQYDFLSYPKNTGTPYGSTFYITETTFGGDRNQIWFYCDAPMVLGHNTLTLDNHLLGTWRADTWGGSSIKIKQDIEFLSQQYDKLFNCLTPRRFKFIDNSSNRYHTGFIVEEMQEAIKKSGLTEKDFAAVITANQGEPTEISGIRYTEIISLNTWQIQLLKPRMTAAEEKIAALENEVSTLKSELENLKNAQNSDII